MQKHSRWNVLLTVSLLGCGHCKKAKPELMDAAKHDVENTKVGSLIFTFCMHCFQEMLCSYWGECFVN